MKEELPDWEINENKIIKERGIIKMKIIIPLFLALLLFLLSISNSIQLNPSLYIFSEQLIGLIAIIINLINILKINRKKENLKLESKTVLIWNIILTISSLIVLYLTLAPSEIWRSNYRNSLSSLANIIIINQIIVNAIGGTIMVIVVNWYLIKSMGNVFFESEGYD